VFILALRAWRWMRTRLYAVVGPNCILRHVAKLGPDSTTSICCELVRRQVVLVQQHLDTSTRCGFTVGLQIVEQRVVQQIHDKSKQVGFGLQFK